MQSSLIVHHKSSFQSLKQSKEQFSKQQRIRDKKIKKIKYLKEQIYKNHNIFHSLSNIRNLAKSMKAQNIIWLKNYQLKQDINSLKEQNSSLKARIWNVQKQNRKMDRQIQAWGLKKAFSNSNKPYIDTATAQKVLDDQDYSITSIKIQILQLQKKLSEKSWSLEEKIQRHKNIKNIKNVLNHELRKKKILLYQQTYDKKQSGTETDQQINKLINQNKQLLIKRNKQLQITKKNIELKKKSKLVLQQELIGLRGQLQGLKQIKPEKILAIRQQAHKLKTEDESYVNQQVKKLSNVRQKYLQFQCKMQDKMGQYIKIKIDLTKQIDQYEKKIQKLIQINSDQNSNTQLQL